MSGPPRRRVTPEGVTINEPPWPEYAEPTFEMWFDWLHTHDLHTQKYILRFTFENAKEGSRCFIQNHQQMLEHQIYQTMVANQSWLRMRNAWLSARRGRALLKRATEAYQRQFKEMDE